MKLSDSDHTEIWHSPRGRKIREIVLGMNDGVVTVVGFLGGLTGSAFPVRAAFLSGLMTTLAGSLSMALGGYLSSKSQNDFFKREMDREWKEIHEVPHLERQEVLEILKRMEFTDTEAASFANRITNNPRVWHEFMMKEELGIFTSAIDNPLIEGGLLGISFLAGGVPPLLPYLFFANVGMAFNVSLAFSTLTLAILGIFKSRLTREPLFKGAIEMALLGGIAALIGLFLGTIIPRIFHLAP